MKKIETGLRSSCGSYRFLLLVTLFLVPTSKCLSTPYVLQSAPVAIVLFDPSDSTPSNTYVLTTSEMRANDAILELRDDKGIMLYDCRVSSNPIQNPPAKPNNSDKWQQYLNFAISEINNCSWTPDSAWTGITLDFDKIKSVTVYITDGGYGSDGFSRFLRLGPMPIEPNRHPTNCSFHLTGVMNFGVVRPGNYSTTFVGETKSSVSLQGVCNRDTSYRLTVNKDSPLTNEDGSFITFSHDTDITISSGVSSETIISGVLVHGPKTPGSYAWSVPVNIDYN